MFPRTALRGAADPRGLTRPQVASEPRPNQHTPLPGLRPLTYRRHSGEAPTCDTNNTALIQINDDVEIGELDDTWSNAFAGWNLIASIGSHVSFAGLIIFLFGMGYAFARKVGPSQMNGGSDTGWAGLRTTLLGRFSFYSTGVCGKSHSTNPRGRVRFST
jgi:hypothetical protein